jgi:hypothetical protein
VTTLRGRDVATVPNLVSVAGLLLTVHGARRLHTPAGIAEVTVGRLLDLADGYLARALDQSSQLGAGLDALLDKAGVTAVGLQLWRGCAPSRPALRERWEISQPFRSQPAKLSEVQVAARLCWAR